MNNFDEIVKVFEGENGPVIAGIGGIVLLVVCHYLTKRDYRVEVTNDKKSFTLEPATATAAETVKAPAEGTGDTVAE